jgi:hypothetical protein
MAAFGKRRDGPGGRRRAERAPVLMAAAMHVVGASRTVSIIDVSSTGARLRTSLPLDLGQIVWLKIPPNDVFGRVRWMEGDLCGIAFDEPLGTAEAARLQARGKVVIMPRLSLEEQLAIEDWKESMAL